MRHAALPPVTHRFRLGPVITDEQRRFLDTHGFLVFAEVATPQEVEMIGDEADAIARAWLAEKRQAVYGVPLFVGKDHQGAPTVQRLPFTSVFSPKIKAFVRDPRFEPIRTLVGDGARVGDQEKDGVVINRYLNVPGSAYPRLGWHTDGLRDLFYLRVPKPMLNVGLHLDHVPRENGGLRLIPGTHKQSFFEMAFRKRYFLDHRPDPAEIAVETVPGDLTVHDGRMWHRVERSPHTGPKSLRRSMYVPYLTDAPQPKGDASPTPLYLRLRPLLNLKWLRQG